MYAGFNFAVEPCSVLTHPPSTAKIIVCFYNELQSAKFSSCKYFLLYSIINYGHKRIRLTPAPSFLLLSLRNGFLVLF